MTPATTEQKWIQLDLGPRQTKSVADAFSRFGWAAKTVREITDHDSFDSTPMFGGAWSALAGELMAAIKTKYNCTVSKANYMQVEAELNAAIVTLKAHPREVDKRSTPEERAEREAARIERERIEREKAAHLAALQTHEYGLAETAKLIKRTLGVFYPATKFSVKSDSYSGGCSIDVSWTDGPASVDNILDRFERCGFDGMQDLKTYHEHPEWKGHRFIFHGDYIRGARAHSVAHLLAACERFTSETGLASPEVVEDGKYTYLKREDRPCGYSFHTTQADEYPLGIICSDSTGHLSACDVVNAIAGHTSDESPALPISQDTIFGVVLGQIQPAAPEASEAQLPSGGVSVSRNDVEKRLAPCR